MRVPDFLYQSAQRWPDNPAIIDEWGALTYAQLETLVMEMAVNLKMLGITPQSGVAVIGRNSRYFIAQCFAVMECGAVVLPLSNQIKTDEMDEIIRTAGLQAVLDDHTSMIHFTNTQKLIRLPHQDWRFVFLNHAETDKPYVPHVKNPAFIRFTSGTTGSAKGIILSHQSIAERTESTHKILQLGPQDTVVWVLSMAYHFVVSIILYLRYGCCIMLCDEFLAETIIDNTNRHKATFLYCSPMHIRLLANDKSYRKMPSLRYAISTSVSISREQCQAFFNRFGIPVSQAYGIIEIGLPVINFGKNKESPEAIGFALPDYQVQIRDDNDTVLPPGETGNLLIRGPGMLDAYLYPPRCRTEILDNGWFHTGDLASMNDDGLIRIEGRKKSMINVSGNKVFPEEVEAVLNQHPAVKVCRVSGFMHAFLGERVQADIVLTNEPEQFEPEELITFCRKRLSLYKIPQKITIVESLPITYSEKLVRY